MTAYAFDDLSIVLNREGAREFLKLSVPMRHGRYHEIRTSKHLVQFNLNAEIKYIQGRHRDWPHPSEWLKRTMGNDWVYYSVGSYNDIFDIAGEYYFPCLSYDENPFFRHSPFASPSVREALSGLNPLFEKLNTLSRLDLPPPLKAFFRKAAATNGAALKHRSERFHRILGEKITILPPDTRHVDYTVIPVVIARGCLYHCGFCRFKTRDTFTPLSKDAILTQMQQMKAFLDRDLPNYNAVFLGQHDALLAGKELLIFAAENACDIFEFHRSYLKDAWLFLFGSVDAMLKAEESLFESLNRLPYRTYINLGLESFDPETLAWLKKPVDVSRVKEAFLRMLEVNQRYPNIEVTANIVLGKRLPPDHLPSLLNFTQNTMNRSFGKGALYFSPLDRRESKTEALACFNKLKRSVRLPAYIYLSQRL